MSGEGEDSEAYLVEQADDRYRIIRDNGRVILVCRDEDSARHYAVLLNQAHQTGYREGYRAARRGLRCRE